MEIFLCFNFVHLLDEVWERCNMMMIYWIKLNTLIQKWYFTPVLRGILHQSCHRCRCGCYRCELHITPVKPPVLYVVLNYTGYSSQPV